MNAAVPRGDRGKLRADRLLVQKGLAATRTEAKAAIVAGSVSAGGHPVRKASELLSASAEVSFARAHPFVSRGGLKLAAALDRFGLSPAGKLCLDIGASTGGFTQVLLERGARRVYAVDVGHGQMHASLRADPRVVLLERVNARTLSSAQIPESPNAVVVDASFISLRLVLAASLALAKRHAWLVALFKPQFEVGPENIGKGGIVRNAAMREEARNSFIDWLSRDKGWTVMGSMPSPVAGGDGNLEYLIAAQNGRAA